MFTSLVVAALAALPLLTQGHATDLGECVRSYTVKAGDTCNSIGAAKGASTYQIMAINPDIDYGCSNLVPDQTICLGTEGADCTTTYVVHPGDTCIGIEAKHGINSTQLYTNNPNIDEHCFNIYSGEVLCVATDILVPDAPENFFKYESISTNQNPQPNTPYVDPSTNWDIVDSEDVEEGEDVPYCDQVGA